MKKIENIYIKTFMVLLLFIDIMLTLHILRVDKTLVNQSAEIKQLSQKISTYQVASTTIRPKFNPPIIPTITTIEPVIVASVAKPIEMPKPIQEKPIEIQKPIQEKPPNQEDQIDKYITEICTNYSNKVLPELVKSVIDRESSRNPKATNGDCLGLMQVSSYWHSKRAAKLGVKDFYDPYGNILLGVDYLNELLYSYKDIRLVLMLYSMNHDDAFAMYKKGQISDYAISVLAKAETYKKRE
jgi:hypothetical protein